MSTHYKNKMAARNNNVSCLFNPKWGDTCLIFTKQIYGMAIVELNLFGMPITFHINVCKLVPFQLLTGARGGSHSISIKTFINSRKSIGLMQASLRFETYAKVFFPWNLGNFS